MPVCQYVILSLITNTVFVTKIKSLYHMYLLQPYQSLTIYWGGALDVAYYQALLFPLQAYTVVFNI